jgi:hypothetical protein
MNYVRAMLLPVWIGFCEQLSLVNADSAHDHDQDRDGGNIVVPKFFGYAFTFSLRKYRFCNMHPLRICQRVQGIPHRLTEIWIHYNIPFPEPVSAFVL